MKIKLVCELSDVLNGDDNDGQLMIGFTEMQILDALNEMPDLGPTVGEYWCTREFLQILLKTIRSDPDKEKRINAKLVQR